MILRPEAHEFEGFFGRYINQVPEGNLLDILADNEAKVTALLSGLNEEQGNYRYEAGKWSVKEVIGHIADNERIMSYRLLRISRGDKTNLPGYDQDLLMQEAPYAHASNAAVLEDYLAVKQATYTLFRNVPDSGWLHIGHANNNTISARAFAYVIAGHEIHHLRVLKEKYLI